MGKDTAAYVDNSVDDEDIRSEKTQLHMLTIVLMMKIYDPSLCLESGKQS